MTRLILGSSLLTLLVNACAPVRGEWSSFTTETDLLTANAEYDRAIVEADAAALDRIYASDCSFVGDKAQLRDKGEQIRHLTGGSIRLLYARRENIAVRRLGPD